MWRPHPGCRMLFFAGALLFAGSAARGDTIVLKNGRRILALSVVEEGDRVKYETSAGQLSLPKSIVDHIEKGGAVPDSPGAAAANLAISPPAIEVSEANTEVERGAVHDGTIDRDFIAKLEGEARSGSRQANAIAAQAHHAAAQFEASHGDMEHALADENSALIYAPDQPDLLMNVAYLHLRRSEFKQSRCAETRGLGLLRHEQAGPGRCRVAASPGAAARPGGAGGAQQSATRQARRGKLQGKRKHALHAALQRR